MNAEIHRETDRRVGRAVAASAPNIVVVTKLRIMDIGEQNR
jgi:hypothetical protein